MSKSITKVQKEVLGYVLRDHLTINKIAKIRGKSPRSVYKIVQRLKQNGWLSGSQIKRFTNLGVTPKKVQKFKGKPTIRLHGVSFKIKILTSSKFYEEYRQNKNVEYIDNNTLMLYKQTLILHISKDFISDQVFKCTRDMFNYLNRILLRIENQLGIIIVRERYTTVKLRSWHYAEINNELAKDCNDKKVKIEIYCRDDGRIWFKIDNSFNLNEAETLHTETAERDMIKLREYFNDIRDHQLVLPSQMYKMMIMITKNQVTFDANMQSHIKAVQELGKQVKRLGDTVSKIAQTKLTDYEK